MNLNLPFEILCTRGRDCCDNFNTGETQFVSLNCSNNGVFFVKMDGNGLLN